MKNVYIILIVLNSIVQLTAQAPDWSVDATGFANSMSITAQVYLDDNEVNTGANLLGAFVGNELRGVASPIDIGGKAFYFMTVHSNVVSGEVVTFKAWLASTNTIHTAPETVAFLKNGQTGNYPNGFEIHLSNDNDFPISLLPIPSQTILSNYPFEDIELNNFLITQDNDPVSWSVENGDHISGIISSSNVLQVSPLDPLWTGTESLLITATETGTNNAHTTSLHIYFTVLPDYGEPVFSGLPVQFVQDNMPFPQGNLIDQLTFYGTCLDYSVCLEIPEGDEPMPGWLQLASNTGSMTLIMEAKFGGTPLSGMSNKLAGFVNGQIAGVASPMQIFGEELYFLSLSNVGKGEIIFKFYDAERQYLHEKESGLNFNPAASVGSFNAPFQADFAPFLIDLTPTGEWTTTVLDDDWSGEQRATFYAQDCHYADKIDSLEVIFSVKQCPTQILELPTDAGLCLQADPDVSAVVWYLNGDEVGQGDHFGASIDGIYHYEGLTILGCPDAKGCPVVVEPEGGNFKLPTNGQDKNMPTQPPPSCGEIVLTNISVDDTPPNAVCQNVTIALDANGLSTLTPNEVDDGSTTTCGTPTLTLSQELFDCQHIGQNIVTLLVEDDYGHNNTCNSTVTVVDNLVPQISGCPASMEYCGEQNISWTPPTATDNCLVDFNSNHQPGDLFPVGTTTVTYTALDGGGNMETCSFDIVIRPLPIVNIVQDIVPDFCQGYALLNADVTNEYDLLAPLTYQWSGGLGNEATALAQNNGNYAVTVSDGYNCESNTTTTITATPSDMLSGYVLLSEKEVSLKNSIVSGGGVGVMENNKKAKIKDGSTVHTFVKAPDIDVDSDSYVAQEIVGQADVPLPPFRYNTHSSNNDIKVEEGQSMTLTDSIYGKIELEEGATLIFDSPTIYMEEIKTQDDATIDFAQSCEVMVEKKVDLKKDNLFNPSFASVIVYTEDKLAAGERVTFTANVFAQKDIQVKKGNANNHSTMTGLFISMEKIDSDEYVDWNWGQNCAPINPVNFIPPDGNSQQASASNLDTTVKLDVFPNPSQGSINLRLSGMESKAALYIRNHYGSTIWTKDLAEGQNNLQLDLKGIGLGHGLYYITAVCSGEILTQKLALIK